MNAARTLRPPAGGMAPPATAILPDETRLELRPLAHAIAEAHFARHPDDLERYGEAGVEWCTHDNQHLLNWAALDLAGLVDFDEQLQWLAGILTSRGYPLEKLADNLRTAAAVVRRDASGERVQPLADRLAVAADSVGA